MNDKIQELIRGMGALTELWLITYNLFLKQGCDSNMAIKHTQGLVSACLAIGNNNKGDNQ